MKNFKKPSSNKFGAGQSNINSVNVLNPDELKLTMRGKEWVNPCEEDYGIKNKAKVRTIVQKNRAATSVLRKAQEIEGTFAALTFLEAIIPFKMQAFKDVPAKITVKDLTTHEVDARRKELAKCKSQ